jgi:hypothetical protein
MSTQEETKMPLEIKKPEADDLALALAERTGRTIAAAVIYALRQHCNGSSCVWASPILPEV